MLTGLAVAVGSKIWAMPGYGGALFVACLVVYAVGAVWLLVAIRPLRGRTLLGKAVVSLIGLLVSTPSILAMLVFASPPAADRAAVVGLIVAAAVWPFALDILFAEPSGARAAGPRGLAARYAPPAALAAISVAVYLSGDQANAEQDGTAWLAIMGLALYGAANVWWLVRGSRRAPRTWWRAALLFLPSTPFLGVCALGFSKSRYDDVALEGALFMLLFAILTIFAGATALWRFQNDSSATGSEDSAGVDA